jgi:hypothetical protein
LTLTGGSAPDLKLESESDTWLKGSAPDLKLEIESDT